MVSFGVLVILSVIISLELTMNSPTSDPECLWNYRQPARELIYVPNAGSAAGFRGSCPKIVASWVSISQLDMGQACGDCKATKVKMDHCRVQVLNGLTHTQLPSSTYHVLIPSCSATYRSASAQRIVTFASTCPVAPVAPVVNFIWWKILLRIRPMVPFQPNHMVSHGLWFPPFETAEGCPAWHSSARQKIGLSLPPFSQQPLYRKHKTLCVEQ